MRVLVKMRNAVGNGAVLRASGLASDREAEFLGRDGYGETWRVYIDSEKAEQIKSVKNVLPAIREKDGRRL